jgi:uncharacterized protein YfiM (DUF2279 family)
MLGLVSRVTLASLASLAAAGRGAVLWLLHRWNLAAAGLAIGRSRRISGCREEAGCAVFGLAKLGR